MNNLPIFLYLAIHDVACYIIAYLLFTQDRTYTAIAFMVIALTTTARQAAVAHSKEEESKDE